MPSQLAISQIRTRYRKPVFHFHFIYFFFLLFYYFLSHKFNFSNKLKNLLLCMCMLFHRCKFNANYYSIKYVKKKKKLNEMKPMGIIYFCIVQLKVIQYSPKTKNKNGPTCTSHLNQAKCSQQNIVNCIALRHVNADFIHKLCKIKIEMGFICTRTTLKH